MLNYFYGIFSGYNILWFILGFIGTIFLLNLFDIIFYVKGEKTYQKINIRNRKTNIFIYCFFTLILSFLCKNEIEVTVGIIAILVMFDIAINFIFFKLSKIIHVKRKIDLTFYKDLNKKIILPSEKVVSAIKVKPIEDRREEENTLNVSHIKGIINKLNCFPLSTSEKKEISDLNISIKKFEEGVGDFKIKSDINDGLNALLKIMAKYSV